MWTIVYNVCYCFEKIVPSGSNTSQWIVYTDPMSLTFRILTMEHSVAWTIEIIRVVYMHKK